MDEATKKRLDELLEKIEEESPQLDLDGEVYTCKEAEASAINNGGLDAQLEYLAGANGIEWLEEYIAGAKEE